VGATAAAWDAPNCILRSNSGLVAPRSCVDAPALPPEAGVLPVESEMDERGAEEETVALMGVAIGSPDRFSEEGGDLLGRPLMTVFVFATCISRFASPGEMGEASFPA
jgi:hypothetical protein